ncbi:MAG TPA: PD-(D/E)XK nuclease family protein [Thermomicrobiaceae bacterium]|nr:PD-(D/E)XK nuclease family protein [Thermomicrobiaceae bacterium]
MSQILTLTPTMLETYGRCPAQYQARYINRQRSEEPPSSALARGSAAHAVLRQVFDLFCGTGAFPIDLHARIAAQLAREPYATNAEHAADVEAIVGWVHWALAEFDGTAQVVAVEQPLEYRYPGSDACPSFRLRAFVDLVLRHDDGSLTVVDWKTATSCRVDPIPTTVARIVAGQTYGNYREIRNSTTFLPAKVAVTEVITREQGAATWREIKSLVKAISTDRVWQPISGPLCPYCPLYHRSCALHPKPSDVDTMRDWLEGMEDAAE